MPQSAKAILHQALELPSNDRAALVEGLIASLDKPNPALGLMGCGSRQRKIAWLRTMPASLAWLMRSGFSRISGKKFEDKIPASRASRAYGAARYSNSQRIQPQIFGEP